VVGIRGTVDNEGVCWETGREGVFEWREWIDDGDYINA
jgi:hypothetical protein